MPRIKPHSHLYKLKIPFNSQQISDKPIIITKPLNDPLLTKSFFKKVSEKVAKRSRRIKLEESNFMDSINKDYFQYELIDNEVKNLSGIAPWEISNKKRLSVTNLLVDKWCELQTSYEIYSQYERPKTSFMQKGNDYHENLEIKIHPIDEELIEKSKVILPEILTKEEKFTELIVENIIKLLKLIEFGNARELKFHHFINKSTKNFINKIENHNDNELILVTGVIDDLKLKDGFLIENLSVLNSFEELFDKLKLIETNLIISDDKTRSSPSLPQQDQVIKAAYNQVSIYLKMLRDLTTNESVEEILLKVAIHHDLDIDYPINPNFSLIFLEKSRLFFDDFIKIQGMDSTEYDYKLSNDLSTLFPNYSKLIINPWKSPLTLRYFIEIYSKLLKNLFPLKKNYHDEMFINYHNSNHRFASLKFKYDEKETANYLNESVKFWLGERNVNPINPDYYNFRTYCGKCDFQNSCIWKTHFEKVLK